MTQLQANNIVTTKKRISFRQRLKKDFRINKYVYIMAIPMIVFFILFSYVPMYGVTIAFKDFSPKLGIINSPWIGFKHFKAFFNSIYFARTLKNTVLMSFYSLLWGFPAAIILALLLNEIRREKFKRLVQTVTYLPHFISLVVICGMLIDFTSTDGLINSILVNFGVEPVNWLTKPEWFRTIYIGSGVWQSIGWDSIIYLAALSGIDPSLYEAATVDGAGRWKQLLHITLPGIAPTIVIMLILNIGGLMSVGYEKIILLYNPMTWETSDVISSYVYRKGLIGADYSFSTAVGLLESAVGFVLLVLANKFSKKISEVSLW
ncbi:putative aldouronate transport system permease protein [Clostridium amylolyticum]|uniref:Putative aldouronate transport system permease protein n=1 Tax=Clostridium amylolyticum TaxID=1121298 RepID=A0A1M6FSK9_9CLOT|nr:ABC transporter permease subunit [Clostridium amylolyticum]SHJ00630.1 putative aldouronate transport system permease protein [Clostridium amylolyticum]